MRVAPWMTPEDDLSLCRALWGQGRPWRKQQEMEDPWKEKQAQCSSSAQYSLLGVSDLVQEWTLHCQLFLLVLFTIALQEGDG